MTNPKDRRKMKSNQPYVPRLIESSNDVEKNPGPPKMIKNGAFPSKDKTSSGRSQLAITNESSSKSSAGANGGNSDKKQSANSDMLGPMNNIEDIKATVERQAETIRAQRAELEAMRKQMEKNFQIQQDFQSELSEIRKNWQMLNESKNNGKGASGVADEPVLNKLETLANAYNDIQDRLYEIDKSWKNNLMIYGVPYSENEEEDPVITEEKVKDILVKKLHISRDFPMNRVQRITYGPDFRGHKPIQVCIVHYRDKEEILRKARLLKGSNIYISEDFSRKVREHRNELFKFMKEVRSRDPARRMTLRYDKLYIGNDIFFVNDRTRRVERLHQNVDAGTNFSSSLGNLLINDSQAASYHDSTWLKRPRSRMGSSRCQTPLSRQNSMSMEEFGPGDGSARGGMSRVGSSASISTRNRRGGLGSPRKSMSIDSSLNSYASQYPPTGGNIGNINSMGIVGDAIPPDTPIPHSQSSYPLVPSSGHHIQMYDDGQPVRESSSASGSPSKRVAFKGIPMLDHETPRMLNGTPHHKPYPRMAELAYAAGEDEVLAIDTDSRPYGPSVTAPNSFPALMHNNPETAIEPYTGIVPTNSSSALAHASHNIGAPSTGGMRAITSDKKSIITASASSTTLALTSAVPPPHSDSGTALSTALPPIDYVPTQHQQSYTIQRQFNVPRDQQLHNYPQQQQYVMMQQHHLQQLQQQQQMSGDGKRLPMLPAIMQNQNGNGKTDATAAAKNTKVNGDIGDDERKHLELEYISTTKGNGHGILANSQNNLNSASMVQTNGSVLKVAMYGEFEMPPETKVANEK